MKNIEKKENQKGASLIEYALLAALIAVVAIAAMTALGTKISAQFENIGASM
ncbi:MAG: Flp family type IVb pilin [bacterium]|nr:Flp family type IVb pilin [bacterium]